MTRRRWIADEWNQKTASLKGMQATHLIRVLRAQAGMEFDVVAGDKVWRAVIAGIRGDLVEFSLLSEVESDPALPISLLLSIFKFDRMEWIIEKATELGIERLVPIIARRSDKHLVQSAPARLERWRRIAREAAKQSRRSDIPEIENVIALKEAARRPPAFQGSRRSLRLLLAEQEQSTTLRATVEAATAPVQVPEEARTTFGVEIAVGPEGGWVADEEEAFVSAGWIPVSLGSRILRAETAGIAATAVVASLFE
jgi:16S rRNA (uracil1498-N3)-methyltransferase